MFVFELLGWRVEIGFSFGLLCFLISLRKRKLIVNRFMYKVLDIK